MRKNLIIFLSGFGFFCLFIIFSYLVHKDLFVQLDFDTTVRLQNNISRRFDDLFSLFSTIGSFEPTLILLGIILLIWRKLLAGIALFSGFVIFHVIEVFGKFFVDHPPPPEFMLRTKRLIEFDQFHVRTEFSYPSGHSGRTIFLATLLLFLLWNNKTLSNPIKLLGSGVIGGFVFIMLLSRVYLGEHWSTDVIGGSILAFALCLIGISFYRQKRIKLVREQSKQIA